VRSPPSRRPPFSALSAVPRRQRTRWRGLSVCPDGLEVLLSA
jgi:hypothetical protein